MIKPLLFLFTITLSSLSFGQEINAELKKELNYILLKDQGFRELSNVDISEKRKREILKLLSITEKEFLENERYLFEKNDSLNLVAVEKIIKKHGYPGKSLVGEPENEAAWFVLQHSDKIEAYFPIIKKAGQENELKMSKVAMMEDRMLMYRGEPQIYGTQAKAIFKVKNPTKQEDVFYIIWPIENPSDVNTRRNQVGIGSTIKAYAQQLGIEYKLYTVEEVDKLVPN